MFLHSLKATETHTHMERRTAHKPRVCILWIINIYGQCLLLWRIATICTARLAYHTLRACHVLQKNLSSLSSEKYISPENLSKNIKKSFCYMLCYVPTTKIFAFCLAQMLQGDTQHTHLNPCMSCRIGTTSMLRFAFLRDCQKE